MYKLLLLLLTMFSCSVPAAGGNPVGDDQKESLLLTKNLSLNESISMREKFLNLILNNNSNKQSEKNIDQQESDNDSFSLGNEVYYFLGAAVLAAVIYFLVPDNNPPAKTHYTFGLPVTPK